jgi:hypothetical protein
MIMWALQTSRYTNRLHSVETGNGIPVPGEPSLEPTSGQLDHCVRRYRMDRSVGLVSFWQRRIPLLSFEFENLAPVLKKTPHPPTTPPQPPPPPPHHPPPPPPPPPTNPHLSLQYITGRSYIYIERDQDGSVIAIYRQ